MTSFSGIPRDSLISFIQKDCLTTEKIMFILHELYSLHELYNTWVLLITIMLQHENLNIECLNIVYNNCENFEEYDKDKQLHILHDFIQTKSNCINIIKKQKKDITEEMETIKTNKRCEQKLWNNISHNKISQKLRFISQNFSEIEYNNLRYLCISTALLIT